MWLKNTVNFVLRAVQQKARFFKAGQWVLVHLIHRSWHCMTSGSSPRTKWPWKGNVLSLFGTYRQAQKMWIRTSRSAMDSCKSDEMCVCSGRDVFLGRRTAVCLLLHLIIKTHCIFDHFIHTHLISRGLPPAAQSEWWAPSPWRHIFCKALKPLLCSLLCRKDRSCVVSCLPLLSFIAQETCILSTPGFWTTLYSSVLQALCSAPFNHSFYINYFSLFSSAL